MLDINEERDPTFSENMVSGAISGGICGALLSIALYILYAFCSGGVPGGYETLVGIFGALISVLGTLPLRLLFPSSFAQHYILWFLPFNFALVNAFVRAVRN